MPEDNDNNPTGGTFFTVSSAASQLGVSKDKVKKLIQERVLSSQKNPLDARQVLIPKEQVDGLKANAPKVIQKNTGED